MAAMGHFVMAPEPQGEQEPQGPAAGGTAGFEQPRVVKFEAQSPAGPVPADFVLSADVCTEDGRPVRQKAVAPPKVGHIMPSVEPSSDERIAAVNEEPESELTSIAYSLFPGRSEVQRQAVTYTPVHSYAPPPPEKARTTVLSPDVLQLHLDEVMLEADGEGETEAERLLNAFAEPGGAPALKQSLNAFAEPGGAPALKKRIVPKEPTFKQEICPAPAQDKPSADKQHAPARTNGSRTSAAPSQTGSPKMPNGYQNAHAVSGDGSSISQRKTAISELITTQGIRPSEIRGVQCTHRPKGQSQLVSPTSDCVLPGHSSHAPAHSTSLALLAPNYVSHSASGSPEVIDSVSSGPSPARGPAWSDTESAGRSSPQSSALPATLAATLPTPAMPGLQVLPAESERASRKPSPQSTPSAPAHAAAAAGAVAATACAASPTHVAAPTETGMQPTRSRTRSIANTPGSDGSPEPAPSVPQPVSLAPMHRQQQQQQQQQQPAVLTTSFSRRREPATEQQPHPQHVTSVRDLLCPSPPPELQQHASDLLDTASLPPPAMPAIKDTAESSKGVGTSAENPLPPPPLYPRTPLVTPRLTSDLQKSSTSLSPAPVGGVTLFGEGGSRSVGGGGIERRGSSWQDNISRAKILGGTLCLTILSVSARLI
jgi:hypothetical protein